MKLDTSPDMRHIKEATLYFSDEEHSMLANQRAYAINQMFILKMNKLITAKQQVELTKKIKLIFHVDWKRKYQEED